MTKLFPVNHLANIICHLFDGCNKNELVIKHKSTIQCGNIFFIHFQSLNCRAKYNNFGVERVSCSLVLLCMFGLLKTSLIPFRGRITGKAQTRALALEHISNVTSSRTSGKWYP